jgi:uncharacterized repeat protein (TIGR01451 family)
MKSVQSILKCLLLFLFVFSNTQLRGQWERFKVPNALNINSAFEYKNTIYLATQKGLFSSIDDGNTWQRKSHEYNINKIWNDGDTLYAGINYYFFDTNQPRRCMLKSIDNGKTWQPIYTNYQKTFLLGLGNVTVVNGNTYAASNNPAQINKRVCDTCAWTKLPGLKNDTKEYTNLVFKDKKIFAIQGDKPYTLYHFEKDSFIKILDSLETFGYMVEKSDTLFMAIKKMAANEKTICSSDAGKTWTAAPPQYQFPPLRFMFTPSYILDRNLFTKFGDYYYLEDYGQSVENRSFYRTKDLIKWDTTQTYKLGLLHAVPVYANQKKLIFKSTYNRFSKMSLDSGATWKDLLVTEHKKSSYYTGFTEFLDVQTLSDNSLCFNDNSFSYGYKSFDGGKSWQLRTSIFDNYKTVKFNNDIYRFETYLYRLVDSSWNNWELINIRTNNNPDLVRNDTFFYFRVYDGKLQIDYSLNIENKWKSLDIVPFNYDRYGSTEEIGNLIFYNNEAYSTDMRNWKILKPAKNTGLDFYKHGDWAYYASFDSLVKTNLVTGLSETLSKDKIFAKKSIKGFSGGESKIWVYFNDNTIYQTEISSIKWQKIFELPTNGYISKMLYHKGYLYIQTRGNTSQDDYIIGTDTTKSNVYRIAVGNVPETFNNGFVFWDKNQNSKFDTDEIPLSNLVVNGKELFTKTDENGRFAFYVPSEGDTLRVTLPKKFLAVSPKFIVTTLKDTVHHIAIQAPEYQDLTVDVNTPSVFRPGFETVVYLTTTNNGLKSQSATAKFVLDKKSDFLSASPTPTRIGDTLEWNLGTLEIDELRSVKMMFKTPVSTPLNSEINLAAKALPIETDFVRADNNFVRKPRVVGSYDPNDKLVEPKTLTPDNVKMGVPLEYTIRFQNTGNYPASFVIVEDTLADYFDLSSFRFISSSHKCSYEYKGKGIIRFIFNDINLPDSISNEAGSHGFASFTITPKGTLKKGDVIQNKAFIYFDYNPAVITPISKLSINTPTPTWEVPKVTENLKIYPNPANRSLNIEIEDEQFKEGFLNIYDMSGRLILSQNVSNKLSVIDVSFLSVGEFICTIKSKDNKVFVNKFLKL